MDQRHNNNSTNNGFLLGLLLGIAITLLFTTKRGRRIIHMLTEEGAKKIDNWRDILEATEEDLFEDEGLMDDEPLVDEEVLTKPVETPEKKFEKPATSPAHTSSREKPKQAAKHSLRFFRRGSK